jgi:SNF2 family DNA or RNA helicase
MGQNRAVTALRMVTRGTVEERILKLQARKRGLIEVLVDEGGTGGGLSADELTELIGEAV